MKKFITEFLRRGVVSLGIGPIVLAVLYLILDNTVNLNVLTVDQVCIGIFSISILAFIAGGMNAIYQIEKLPLMLSILIHGVVLYISYFATYIVNGWLEFGKIPILVFTSIFIAGYLVIWLIIYTITKRNTDRINKLLSDNQHNSEN